jgi:hypothetical protein
MKSRMWGWAGCWRRLSSQELHTTMVLAITLSGVLPASAQTNVSIWTYHNDNARTGQNLRETQLTLGTVNSRSFGKLFSQPLDGWLFAQPLYLPGIAIPGKGTHNVVYVATEHNSVYAFDADSNVGSNAQPLWHVNFLNPSAGVLTVPIDDYGFDNPPELGITGTPVIDPTNGTLYVVAMTKETTNTQFRYVHRLHALDIHTGAERAGSPVVIQPSVAGTGAGSDSQGLIPFSSYNQLQRPGLVLLNGVVYAAFGSIGDMDPYHGWVLGFDAQTLALVQVFNDTPNGDAGGIWMSGAAPASDADGNLYCLTGNGDFDANLGVQNFGDSFLKLTPTGTNLLATDYFTPYDQALLNTEDGDLGSGGALVLPDEVGSPDHPHLLVGGGKEGTMYLLDRDNLGQFNTDNDSQIVQSLIHSVGSIYSAPAYFNSYVYFLAFQDVLKAFSITNGQLSEAPVSQGNTVFGFTGATPSISANGTNNAIVWTVQVDGWQSAQPAILRAYNATNLNEELYNSSQAETRDVLGPALKFTVPTIVNGKVYVCTANHLHVLGNLGSPTISNPGFDESHFQFTLSTIAGLSYILQCSDSLNPLQWRPLQGFVGNGSSMTLTDTNSSVGMRFYRVQVSPAQ